MERATSEIPPTPGTDARPVVVVDPASISDVAPVLHNVEHSPLKVLFMHRRRGPEPSESPLSAALFARYDTLVPRMHPNDLDFCLRVQENALSEFKPELLVADGFGAWVAWKLMERGLYSGPTVFVGPAIHMVEEEIARRRPPGTNGRSSPREHTPAEPKIPSSVVGPVVVIHGVGNHLVPIEDSRKLVQASGGEPRIKLVEVAGERPTEAEVLEWCDWVYKVAMGPAVEGREEAGPREGA